MKRNGFTLIEILIAITILAFISIFTSRMISQGVSARAKVERALERTVAVRNALAIMTRDIEMAFNYRDIDTEIYNKAQMERRKKASPPPPPPPGPAAPGTPPAPPPPPPVPPIPGQPGSNLEEQYPLREAIILTAFIGERDRLNFTSLNNFRAIRNSKQSDQAEIGYSLRNCANRVDPSKTSQCLWRRVAADIDKDVTEGGKDTVLLENVKSLSFRYLGPEQEEEWVESWRSDGQGTANAKDRFPYAVEITLVAEDSNSESAKEVSMTVVAELRFPNNKPVDKSAPVN